jgi:hypothetical protein|tara:strand:+ start:902 stop:1516 length:615 start_codon:yes stop_codon:yes gene_type:complete
MLTYNLKEILLSEEFKTVDIDKVPAVKKGYDRTVLDPIAANPFAGSGKAKMDYEDLKIKKGKKGYKKRKYTKKGDYWEKPIKTATPKTDPGMKPDASTAPSKPVPRVRTTNLPVPFQAPKDPDIMDAEFEEVPGTPKQVPADAKEKKKKKKGFGPEAMYSSGGPEYSLFMSYDPNRFKKGAIQKARGVEPAHERLMPKLKDIIR